MKELRDPRALRRLLDDIEALARKTGRRPRLMEVCGTHTMALFKSGLTPLLAGAGVEMVSGPGCPVCITPNAIHEAAIAIVTGTERVTLAAFGDMTRVPTTRGSLQTADAGRGRAPEDRLFPRGGARGSAARTGPGRSSSTAPGFETTIPAIAFTVRQAAAEGLRNYSVLPALWLVPPALRAVLEAREVAVDGFIYPGHVSAVIGVGPYEFVARDHGVPGAVAGFEPGDILLGRPLGPGTGRRGKPRVALEYSRAIGRDGNPVARALMEEIFEPYDACWRGLGTIPESGLRFKKAFAGFDAARRFGLDPETTERDLAGCRCGDVLRGVIRPEGCRLFGKKCRPDSPLGPCMVSYEGACLIHFKYGPEKGVRA